jgi:hypothetical protein
MAIIDTPGIGSTLQCNTEATMQVLPECDVAIFVISADPPITEAELQYLRRLKSTASRVLYVVNKMDHLQPDEARSANEFLTSVLTKHDLMKPEERLFCVSARNGLKAKQTLNGAAVAASGIAALEDHLVQTLAREKGRLLEYAVRHKARDICVQALAELKLRERALKMPIEQLIDKSEVFHEALRAIEEQRQVTRDILAGDHRRLREALDFEIDWLRREVDSKMVDVIDKNLSTRGSSQEAFRPALSDALRKEFEIARESYVRAFAADAGAILHRHQGRIEDLVDKVHRTAAEIFDITLARQTEHEAFLLGQDPYWVTEDSQLGLIPDLTRVTDMLLPQALRLARTRKRMMQKAGDLVVRNAENLRWAIVRGLDDLFRKATAQFEERLEEAMRTTRDVIAEALAQRHVQFFAAQPELDRITIATGSLAKSCEQL